LGRAIDCGAPPASSSACGPEAGAFSKLVFRLRIAAAAFDSGVAARKVKEGPMNLFVWLPAMFVLGLASMGVCLAFTIGCEHI
jgi:hypothetical protein